MNIFFGMADGSLITPPLGGTILAGITRDSIIQLCRDRGLVVHERPYTLKEIRDDAQSGSLREIFACGTAAVVQSIGVLKDDAGEIRVPGGDLATSLRRELTSIQKGDTADKHGWVYRVV